MTAAAGPPGRWVPGGRRCSPAAHAALAAARLARCSRCQRMASLARITAAVSPAKSRTELARRGGCTAVLRFASLRRPRGRCRYCLARERRASLCSAKSRLHAPLCVLLWFVFFDFCLRATKERVCGDDHGTGGAPDRISIAKTKGDWNTRRWVVFTCL